MTRQPPHERERLLLVSLPRGRPVAVSPVSRKLDLPAVSVIVVERVLEGAWGGVPAAGRLQPRRVGLGRGDALATVPRRIEARDGPAGAP